jgi:hypothetical protein
LGTAPVRAVPVAPAAGVPAGALAAGPAVDTFGAEGNALVAAVLAAPAPVPAAALAGFADVGAAFCAGAAAAGSGDDICVADVLTPGSRSAGGGAIGRFEVGAVLCGVLEPLLCPLCAPAAALKAAIVAKRIPRTRHRASSCHTVSIINLPPLGLAWLGAPALLKERLP